MVGLRMNGPHRWALVGHDCQDPKREWCARRQYQVRSDARIGPVPHSPPLLSHLVLRRYLSSVSPPSPFVFDHSNVQLLSMKLRRTMSSASRRSFVGPAAIAVLLFSSGVLGQTTRTPTIWQVRYSPDGAVGPDGPWNVLNQTIDFPDQFVLMYPSLAQASLIIPTTACQPSNASCPEPLPGLWAGSAAQNTAKSMDGPPFDAATWDPISEPLGLRGQGHYIAQRITLKPLQSNGDTAFLDNQAVAVGESFAQSYPGGARYTSTVGFVRIPFLPNRWMCLLYANQSYSSFHCLAAPPTSHTTTGLVLLSPLTVRWGLPSYRIGPLPCLMGCILDLPSTRFLARSTLARLIMRGCYPTQSKLLPTTVSR